jgi:protein-L-isoaspartate(D-aspartate) O-methyltransferase
VRNGLQLWLAGHEPGVCSLWAESSIDGVPDLFGQAERFRATLGVLVGGMLAVLAWSRSGDELCAQASAGGESVAGRLCDHVRAWHAAGRPTDAQLHIAAFPREAPRQPGETEVEERWARFVLRWATR